MRRGGRGYLSFPLRRGRTGLMEEGRSEDLDH